MKKLCVLGAAGHHEHVKLAEDGSPEKCVLYSPPNKLDSFVELLFVLRVCLSRLAEKCFESAKTLCSRYEHVKLYESDRVETWVFSFELLFFWGWRGEVSCWCTLAHLLSHLLSYLLCCWNSVNCMFWALIDHLAALIQQNLFSGNVGTCVGSTYTVLQVFETTLLVCILCVYAHLAQSALVQRDKFNFEDRCQN